MTLSPKSAKLLEAFKACPPESRKAVIDDLRVSAKSWIESPQGLIAEVEEEIKQDSATLSLICDLVEALGG